MAETGRGRRILMVAGEASGDHLGADLAAQILAQDPHSTIIGMAGERMRAAGVKPLVRIEEVAGMGATELASTIGPILRAFSRMRKELREGKPDLVILIDFADFNLKFAWFAKRAGVPVLYYVPPQVWAWRRWRIGSLVKRADRLAVVFPFEAELYERAGGHVTFVGHPALDRVKPGQDPTATRARHGLSPNKPILSILPGSRRGEIQYLLQPMIEAARLLAARHDVEPVIALASTLTEHDLRKVADPRALSAMRIIQGDTYSIIAASTLAMVASGTATLEAALLGCPTVIAYKMSPLSYRIGRMLIRGVNFIGMPNLLAGRSVLPELIQHDVTPSKLVEAVEPFLDPLRHDQIAAELRALRAKLGQPGAAARTAQIALDMIA